jgi:Sap, sulfolipid-1-addressing protein
MWGLVLFLALGAATDPLRLGMAALLVSRPRPLPNLFVFWLGGIAAGLAAALVVLTLLRDFALTVVQGVSSAAATSTAGQIEIAIGALALSSAALIAFGIPARTLTPSGDRLTRVLQPSTPTAFSRLSTRAHETLEGGCLWVAFVAGLGSATPPIECLVALTAIAASRAAIGTQFSASVLFTVVILAVIEIPLISSLATPARTQSVMLQLHSWVRAHRRRIFAVMLAVTGASLMIKGMSVA